MSVFQNGFWGTGFDFPNAISQVLNYQLTGGALSSVTPFSYGQSLQNNSASQPPGLTLGVNGTEFIKGFWFYTTSLPTGSNVFPIFQFYDVTGNATQVLLGFNSTGQLQFYKGFFSTAYGSPTSSSYIAANTWVYIQMKVVFNASTGSVECRIGTNTSPVISISSLNTVPTGNVWCNNFSYGSAGSRNYNGYFDDIYALDTTGASPLNTYLATSLSTPRFITDAPTSDAGPNQFTSSNSEPTGSHYKDVNQLPFSSDTNYLYDNNSGDQELFGYPALSASSVLLINLWYRTELDSSGARTVAPQCKSGSTTASGTAITPPTGGFVYANYPFVDDPNTSNPWSSGTVTAAQNATLGLEIAS